SRYNTGQHRQIQDFHSETPQLRGKPNASLRFEKQVSRRVTRRAISTKRTRSTREKARRWSGGRFFASFSSPDRESTRRIDPRRKNYDSWRVQKEIQFGQQLLRVLLLLGLLSLGDEFANRTGVPAIERFNQSFLERVGL